MTKKKEPVEEVDPFMGGEDDDLMDMQYIQDETNTTKVETQPPETKEEAEAIAEVEASQQEAIENAKESDEDGSVAAEESTDDVVAEEVVSEKEAEAEAPTEEAVLDDEPKIPKDRFDDVNERMKKAEKKVEQLEAKMDTPPEVVNEEPEPEPYDYKTKENEAMEAMLEGDGEKYSAVNAEIRQAEKDELLREAKKLAAQGDQQVQDNITFEEAGAKIEADYPQLTVDSETYSEEAREEMIELYLGYARSGSYTRVQALQRAAAQTARIYDLKTTAEDNAEVPDNVISIKPGDPKKKAAIANAQPPAMEARAPGSNEEPRVDVKSMSDEEFGALPESSKRRLRGDIL